MLTFWARKAACLVSVATALWCGLSSPAAAAIVTQAEMRPIAVYNGISNAFGLAYDPGRGVIWVKGNDSLGLRSIKAYNTINPLLLPNTTIDGQSAKDATSQAQFGFYSTPNSLGEGAQALGFDASSGQLLMHDTGTNLVKRITPISGAVGSSIGIPPGASFLDGLDMEGTDVYSSAEPMGAGNSYKNGAIFLDGGGGNNTSSFTGGANGTVRRWAGIEAISQVGKVFAVADTTIGRTISIHDINTGTILSIDPTGNPFASRLEDLAFDGRYLYGSDYAQHKVFVFDIIGPGGQSELETVPEPATMTIWGLGALGCAAAAYRRRKRAA